VLGTSAGDAIRLGHPTTSVVTHHRDGTASRGIRAVNSARGLGHGPPLGVHHCVADAITSGGPGAQDKVAVAVAAIARLVKS
jgi:hypothetical protein